MKKLNKILGTVAAVILMSATARADSARLQVIHNAADPAAASVDIYVNGNLFEGDFGFREATEFRTVPAGVTLNIGIAPGNSGSVDDTLVNIPVTLAANETYVAIAGGVLDPGAFAPNPDARAIGFQLFSRGDAREAANLSFLTDLLVFHGATDAPAVDVRVRGLDLAPLVGGLGYGEFSGYRPVLPWSYTLDITPAGDKETVVASFKANLKGLGGQAAVVFASGFLDPSANQNGAGFGLYAALPGGAVVALEPVVPTAKLQVIHNAADPAAASVDLYVNGELYEDDFDFREATEFRTVPAGVELNVGVAPGTSASVDDTLASFAVTLEAHRSYIVVANGVLNPGDFAPNPDALPIGFTLLTRDDARLGGGYFDVSVSALHGATDAPAVDVWARGVGPLFTGLVYGKFSDYAKVPAARYVLDVALAGDPSAIVASYEADLSGLRGGAVQVFASGFLDPSANQSGSAFGLFAALPSGAVVELPLYTPTARLQVIHNAADPAAATVDIYVNGELYEDDFGFRKATEFRTVPAEVTLNIGVAPPNSVSAADAIATIPVTLAAGETYVAIANGVLSPAAFAPNPDAKPIGFALYPRGQAREASRGNHRVDLVAFHGVTDAPAVDVLARRSPWRKRPLFDDLAYGDYSSYRAVLPRRYVLDVTLADNNDAVVKSYLADLRGLGGTAAVVFASGFLTPSQNQNGPAFGLFAALPTGDVVALGEVAPTFKLAEEERVTPTAFRLDQNFPNPFNPATTISFALPEAADVSVRVYNLLGREVRTLVNRRLEAGEHSVEFDARNLASGTYFYRLQMGDKVETRKMTLIK